MGKCTLKRVLCEALVWTVGIMEVFIAVYRASPGDSNKHVYRRIFTCLHPYQEPRLGTVTCLQGQDDKIYVSQQSEVFDILPISMFCILFMFIL